MLLPIQHSPLSHFFRSWCRFLCSFLWGGETNSQSRNFFAGCGMGVSTATVLRGFCKGIWVCLVLFMSGRIPHSGRLAWRWRRGAENRSDCWARIFEWKVKVKAMGFDTIQILNVGYIFLQVWGSGKSGKDGNVGAFQSSLHRWTHGPKWQVQNQPSFLTRMKGTDYFVIP